MQRRTVLGVLAGTGVVGSSILSGCLHASSGSGYRWETDVVGELDAVSQGLVLGREGKFGHGQVFALAAETGERQWSYGDTDEGNYTELTVSDGVFFGWCGDTGCMGLNALDMDGTERWTGDNSGPDSPRVADGTVYVVDEFGVAQAFDAQTGTEQWTSDLRLPDQRVAVSRIVSVADILSVVVDDLVALDRADGSTRWRYTPDRQPILAGTASAGVAYLVTPDRVLAIEDGEEVWSRDVEATEAGTETEILGLTADHLVVLVAETSGLNFHLNVFDLATGTRAWVSDAFGHPWDDSEPRVAMDGDVVYVGTDRLRALDTASGSERWQTAVDEGEVQTVTVDAENDGSDHSIFFHVEDTIVRVTPEGERTWSASVDERIRDYLIDEFVFVTTEEAIYAFEQ